MKLKFFFYALLTAVLIVSCTGEDGDPGPQGEQGVQGEKGDKGDNGPTGSNGANGVSTVIKLGYLKGTVSGNRRDGTAFNESFTYEYSRDTITKVTDNKLIIERGGTSQFTAALGMSLISVDGVFKVNSDPYSVLFSFWKKLDANTLFTINARPYCVSTAAFSRVISSTENEKYNFSTSWPNESVYFNHTYWNGTSAGSSYASYAKRDNENYEVHYDQVTGSLLGLFRPSDNSYIESGAIFDFYNKLKLKMNSDLGIVAFHEASTGASLAEQVPAVPADQVTITNFAKDANTGVVTFDFEIKISGYKTHTYRENTTKHDLTIKGQFNSGGRVYNTTGRTRG